jgi:hypothetical protein
MRKERATWEEIDQDHIKVEMSLEEEVDEKG